MKPNHNHKTILRLLVYLTAYVFLVIYINATKKAKGYENETEFDPCSINECI